MSRRYDKEDARRRILSVCVRLFIEKGYSRTTNAEILRLADVTNGTFYNIFKSKDGILLELTEFMFSNQFNIAGQLAGTATDPIFLYALETSIQMTLTELNENLREIYVEAYTAHLSQLLGGLTSDQCETTVRTLTEALRLMQEDFQRRSQNI